MPENPEDLIQRYAQGVDRARKQAQVRRRIAGAAYRLVRDLECLSPKDLRHFRQELFENEIGSTLSELPVPLSLDVRAFPKLDLGGLFAGGKRLSQHPILASFLDFADGMSHVVSDKAMLFHAEKGRKEFVITDWDPFRVETQTLFSAWCVTTEDGSRLWIMSRRQFVEAYRRAKFFRNER